MQQRVTTLKMDRKAWTPPELLKVWQRNLQEKDRSAGTVTKYTQAVTHFLAWYEQQEHTPLSLEALTPIALIGYRNELQHEQHKSISTINLRINALLRQAQVSRDKERNYAVVQVLLQTGIRLSECAALTFEDMTFGERSGILRIRAGKGNKARSVPLNTSAREAIAIYVAPRLGIEKPSLRAVVKGWPKPKAP